MGKWKREDVGVRQSGRVRTREWKSGRVIKWEYQNEACRNVGV